MPERSEVQLQIKLQSEKRDKDLSISHSWCCSDEWGSSSSQEPFPPTEELFHQDRGFIMLTNVSELDQWTPELIIGWWGNICLSSPLLLLDAGIYTWHLIKYWKVSLLLYTNMSSERLQLLLGKSSEQHIVIYTQFYRLLFVCYYFLVTLNASWIAELATTEVAGDQRNKTFKNSKTPLKLCGIECSAVEFVCCIVSIIAYLHKILIEKTL